jgi:G3E family GTPase
MIPLALLAGFFGAGKTRFLTTVIPELQARGMRTQVLLNDFETAEIDTTRLATLNSLVTPLSGECVCCSSVEELLTALSKMPVETSSVVLIEANGATETEELLDRLTSDRRLAHYTLPLQVTIVDAKRWQKRWWHKALEVNQTRTATHVHMNWTHRVRADRLAAVEEGIRSVNPHAVFTSPADFAADLERFAVGTAVDNTRPTLAAPRPHDRAHDRTGHAHGHADHGHDHADHDHAHHDHARPTHVHEHPFASIVLGLPEIVSREAFMAFVRGLPSVVVRAKGLVRFADRPDAMFVWNRVDGRKTVTLDQSVPHATQQPIALFIGVGLPTDELRAGIEALRA